MAWNNGSYNANTIKEMQSWYGTTADGKWGQNSSAAAGGRGVDDAYTLWSNSKRYYGSYSDYQNRGSSGGGSSSGGSQSSSTGINRNTIKEMQNWYGTTADGIWGKNSTAAAGGMSVDDAYNLWSNSRRYYGSYSDYQSRGSSGGSQSSTGSSGSTGGYTGSGYNNGGLTDAQIREMQNYYGVSADGKWGKNSSAAAGGLSAADAWNRYQSSLPSSVPDAGYDDGYDGGYDGGYDSGADSGYDYSGPMSYGDYLQRVGGDDYQAAVQKAIEAQVQAATEQYNSQIENAGKDYEENARRAYVNKMMAQRNMDQELAANGVYGGMADSQRIATETNYENDLTAMTNQYQSTISELQQAITSAKLAGDAQAAEAMASYLSQVQAQYASYLQNERSIQAEIDMFNRQLAAQQAQQAQAAAAASAGGGASGGYSGGGSSGGYSGGGYDNGGLTEAQIRQMQQALGVTADGKWGAQSSAAADGMSALEAWQAYQQANRGNIVDSVLARYYGR